MPPTPVVSLSPPRGRQAGVALEHTVLHFDCSARRIEFRVGIHVGDEVEESDGDLMCDGVNIAAPMEGIAEPGGICLSEDRHVDAIASARPGVSLDPNSSLERSQGTQAALSREIIKQSGRHSQLCN
jgi:class 3 adenylate cyclase